MLRSPIRRGMLLALTLGALAPVASAQAPAASQSAVAPPSARFQRQDEPLKPFQPREPRTAEQERQIQALAWYCTGYLHQQRREALDAYRAYQQAVHYDPASAEAYNALWRLALEMRQIDAAVRYLLRAVELDESNFDDLYRLAGMLARGEASSSALQLLERATKSGQLDAKSPEYLRLTHQLGQLYERAGRHADAADAMQSTVEALEHPDHFKLDRARLRSTFGKPPAQVHLEVADIYRQAGRTDEALKLLTALESEPNVPDLPLHRARLLLQRNDAENARAELEKFLGGGGNKPVSAYQLLGEILAKLGKGDEYTAKLETASAADPALRYLLADHYRALNNYDAAEKLFIAALAEQPRPEGYAGLAAVYRQSKRVPELFRHLGRAYRENRNGLEVIEPELPPIAQDADLRQALAAVARQELKDAPDDVQVGSLHALARVLNLAGEVDAAAEFYRALLDRAGDDETAQSGHFELGLMFLRHQRAAEAAEVFRAALDKGASLNPGFQMFLVRALAMSGQTEAALEAADKLASGELPDELDRQAALRAMKPWVYYQAQRWDEAAAAYEALIQEYWPRWTAGLAEADGFPGNPLREAHFLLSNIYVERRDYQRSEELLLRVLQDAPEDPHASNDLGYLWADQGRRLDEAQILIRRAVQAEPDNAAYLDSLGWLLAKQQQYPEAATHLEKATAQPEGADPVIWDHLGDVYLNLQRPEKARAAWEKSLQLFQETKRPDAKRMQDVKRKLEEVRP